MDPDRLEELTPETSVCDAAGGDVERTRTTPSPPPPEAQQELKITTQTNSETENTVDALWDQEPSNLDDEVIDEEVEAHFFALELRNLEQLKMFDLARQEARAELEGEFNEREERIKKEEKLLEAKKMDFEEYRAAKIKQLDAEDAALRRRELALLQ